MHIFTIFSALKTILCYYKSYIYNLFINLKSIILCSKSEKCLCLLISRQRLNWTIFVFFLYSVSDIMYTHRILTYFSLSVYAVCFILHRKSRIFKSKDLSLWPLTCSNNHLNGENLKFVQRFNNILQVYNNLNINKRKIKENNILNNETTYLQTTYWNVHQIIVQSK